MSTYRRSLFAVALGVALLFIALQRAAGSTGTILVYGDSLSAAYGLRPEQGWVALLAQRLHGQGYGYEIVNASISGETTDGGLARLSRSLELHAPAIVVLELGANDALRGLPVPRTQANLTEMVRSAQQAGARVLLVGIRIPPNYGPRYTEAFARMYPAVASAAHVPLVPFLLEKVALDPALMQADGLHPNAAAGPAILDTIWPYLQPMLKSGATRPAAGGR